MRLRTTLALTQESLSGSEEHPMTHPSVLTYLKHQSVELHSVSLRCPALEWPELSPLLCPGGPNLRPLPACVGCLCGKKLSISKNEMIVQRKEHEDRRNTVGHRWDPDCSGLLLLSHAPASEIASESISYLVPSV